MSYIDNVETALTLFKSIENSDVKLIEDFGNRVSVKFTETVCMDLEENKRSIIEKTTGCFENSKGRFIVLGDGYKYYLKDNGEFVSTDIEYINNMRDKIYKIARTFMKTSKVEDDDKEEVLRNFSSMFDWLADEFRYEMGYAAALSVFLFALIIIFRYLIGGLLNLIGKSDN